MHEYKSFPLIAFSFCVNVYLSCICYDSIGFGFVAGSEKPVLIRSVAEGTKVSF